MNSLQVSNLDLLIRLIRIHIIQTCDVPPAQRKEDRGGGRRTNERSIDFCCPDLFEARTRFFLCPEARTHSYGQLPPPLGRDIKGGRQWNGGRRRRNFLFKLGAKRVTVARAAPGEHRVVSRLKVNKIKTKQKIRTNIQNKYAHL